MWALTHSKLASSVKQNVCTVTIKYTVHTIVSAMLYQLPTTSHSVTLQKVGQPETFAKHQAGGTICKVLHDISFTHSA